MKAAQLLVSCLENEGVRFAFGIPGEENLELMDALRGSAVRFVLTRHEGAAAFMADVYGRLSGRAGVCLATLGPGATNLVTGVADAFLDRAPLVAIPARASVEQAALLMGKAERPIILAGNGVIRNGSSAELTQFAERLHIPVVTTVMGKGAIPWTSPMSLLTIGILPHDHELAGLDDSDLVICVGYDFVEYDPRSWNPRGDRRIIHVDGLPAEISAQYIPEVEVIGEIRESLQTLGQRIKRARPSGRSLPSRDGVMKTLESELGEHSSKAMNPQRILWDLRDILEPDDLLISDVGAHKLWLSRFFRVEKPKTIVISNGLSPMGIAVPGGIAAKLMDPNRRVVTVSGDGGFLMSVHELETARRENAPTVNLVFRDSGLGSIRWKQMAKFNRTVGTEFSNPDFADLAKAFGLRGFRVEHPSELNSILGEALESNAPCLVDVPIDYGTNPFLPPRALTAGFVSEP